MNPEYAVSIMTQKSKPFCVITDFMHVKIDPRAKQKAAGGQLVLRGD